jgi:predicted enzyme related to lactoylglutathione lyase
MPDKQIGQIEWRDLTINDAVGVKDFYSAVVGWTSEPVSMGEYDDFIMKTPESGETIAGVCHARGENAEIPPQWMMYVRVADVAASVEQVQALGGAVLLGPRTMGDETYYVIRDPAGAVLTIFS